MAAAALVGAAAWWSWNATGGRGEMPAPPPVAPSAEFARDLAAVPEVQGEAAPPAESARASVAPEAPPTPKPPIEPAPAEELAAEVDVRFVDAIGNPWSGVRFAVRGSRWAPNWTPNDAAQSDANGRVTLRVGLPRIKNPWGVARREYPLEFEASRTGLATLARSATLRAGETKHFGNLVMVPGGRILGRVEDGDGKGLVGALVGVAPVELSGDLERAVRHGGEFQQGAPRTKSGASGEFVLDGAPAGKLRAWAHAEGSRYTWSEPLEVPAQGDAQDVVLVLRPLLAADRITGRVLDPDGAPLVGAYLWADEHSRGAGTGGTVPVDEAGRFELLIVHDDSTYDLRGGDVLERFGSTLRRGVLPGTLDVELRLQRLEQFGVRVRDPEGKPVAGARFFVSTNSRMEYPSTSAAPGEYSIARPTEPFTLQCVAKGFRTTRIGHPRTPIMPTTLPEPPAFFEVVLQPAKLLRGRVTAEGAPVAERACTTRATTRVPRGRPPGTDTAIGSTCPTRRDRARTWTGGSSSTATTGRASGCASPRRVGRPGRSGRSMR
ncbi:MAG: carboxypeptidase regulatory-like domain-containing protein [Planctomycetes bacterium]|nr:carboxypeptidase regulatory-like domain-containing protein [Planctomycetota bacterium]